MPLRDEKGRFTKGNLPWNTNKKCPQLSNSLKGHIISREIRQKISNAKKGVKQPKGFGQKISKILYREYENGEGRGFKKGSIPHNKGKKCPEISDGLKQTIRKRGVHWRKGIPRSEKVKQKIRKTLMGHKVSVETRAKLSESHIITPRAGFRGSDNHQHRIREIADWFNNGKNTVAIEQEVKLRSGRHRFIDVLVNGLVCVEVGQLRQPKIVDLLDSGFQVLHFPY